MSSSLAPIAQSAERLHGKEKVNGSIPFWGSGVKRSPSLWDVGHSHRGGVAQSVEQAAHNRCVTGSSPVTATDSSRLWGRSFNRLLFLALNKPIRSS